jgi:hypothetical protein
LFHDDDHHEQIISVQENEFVSSERTLVVLDARRNLCERVFHDRFVRSLREGEALQEIATLFFGLELC